MHLFEKCEKIGQPYFQITLVIFQFMEQGKIVAELQPTEARLRQACMRKVPQVIKAKQSSKKSHHQEKKKAEELQWSFANSLRRSAVKSSNT